MNTYIQEYFCVTTRGAVTDFLFLFFVPLDDNSFILCNHTLHGCLVVSWTTLYIDISSTINM